MRLFLDICQGLGVSAAAGLRPFLPTLLVGLLARWDLGVDFGGTSFAFLESPAWLLGAALALVLSLLLRGRTEAGPVGVALGVVAVALGALLAAGSLADRGEPVLVGLAVGIVAATLGLLAARDLMARTRERLDPEARAALPVYFEGAGLVLAGLSVLVPPVSLLAAAFLAWLLAGGRRRGGERFAGLRILR